jgi:hypothetical protein
MSRQARRSGLVMGLDTYMIAESHARSTSTPTPPPDHHQRDKPAPCRGPGEAVPAVSGWTSTIGACIQPHSPRTGVSPQTRRASENPPCSAAADPVQMGRSLGGSAASTASASGPARSCSTVSMRLVAKSTFTVQVNPLRSVTVLMNSSPVWISRRSQVRRRGHAARRRIPEGSAARKRIRSTGGRHHTKVTSVVLANRSPSARSSPARLAAASSGSSSSDRSGLDECRRARPGAPLIAAKR